MEERVQGTVASFQAKRGFGVIQPEIEGETLFVHWTQILSEEKWPQLAKDTLVEYTPGVNEQGKATALAVTLPGGGLISKEQDPSIAERTLSNFTCIGQVVEFSKEKGWGFIVCSDDLPWPQLLPAGSRIFVSREDLVIAEGSACTLVEGMEVEFRVFLHDKGVQAAEVTGPGGDPIKGAPKAPGTKGKGKGKGKGDNWKPSFTSGRDDANSSSSVNFVPPKQGGVVFPWQNASAGVGVQRTIQKSSHTNHWGSGFQQDGAQRQCKHCGEWGHIASICPQSQCYACGEYGHMSSVCATLSGAGLAENTSAHLIVQDEAFLKAFLRASPGEQAALGIMEQAMEQAATAQAAIARAKALIKGPAQVRGLTNQFDNTQPGGEQFLSENDLAQACYQIQQAQGGKKKKQMPCRFFAENRCRKGEECEFSHDPEMYRPRPLEKKTAMLCRFFEVGKCSRGDECPFAHGEFEQIAIQSLASAAE